MINVVAADDFGIRLVGKIMGSLCFEIGVDKMGLLPCLDNNLKKDCVCMVLLSSLLDWMFYAWIKLVNGF